MPTDWKPARQRIPPPGADNLPTAPRRPKHLPPAETIAVAKLAAAGQRTPAIAKVLGLTPAEVKQALVDAKTVLEALSPQAAEDWITASRVAAAEGNHKPAMALLQHVKVVEPPATMPTGPQVGVQVQFVGFGFAGLPPQPQPSAAPAPPAIDTTATVKESPS